MASEKATVASGADAGDALRRRNVAGQTAPVAGAPVEVDNKKSLPKKVMFHIEVPAAPIWTAC